MIKTAGAVLTAVLLSLCFPSGGLWWLAWVALIPFILACQALSIKGAFWRGYLSGFIFFFLTIFWIHHVTFVGLVLLSCYLALYWAVFAACIAWSCSRPLWWRLFFLSTAGVVLEYARAHFLTGFGWSALAHTQSANILLIQVADITGTYGVACVLIMVNVVGAAWMAACFARSGFTAGLRRSTWGVVAIVVAVLFYGMWRVSTLDVTNCARVALVQGNISLEDYGDPGSKPRVVEKYLALSRAAMRQSPELIIWPETAFPQFIWDYPELFEKIRDFSRENRVKVMLGAVTRVGDQYFNSALLVDGGNRGERVYNKQHLVLFGEYIPFRQQLPLLGRFVPIDDFTAGGRDVLFSLGKDRLFAPLICFEDTVPGLARRAVLDGAGFLVNMTNDAWFGASRQPRMHLDNAIFRAVENRVSLLRATNTGVSAAVMPSGELAGCVSDKGLQVGVEGFRVVDVPAQKASVTFYTKYGDVFVMLNFIAIILMICLKAEYWQEEQNV